VVPQGVIEDLVARLQAKEAAEADYRDAVARGEFNNAWVDRLLQENGVAVEIAEGV